MGTLRAEGLTEETSHELHNLLKIVQTIQRQNKENQLRLAAQQGEWGDLSQTPRARVQSVDEVVMVSRARIDPCTRTFC